MYGEGRCLGVEQGMTPHLTAAHAAAAAASADRCTGSCTYSCTDPRTDLNRLLNCPPRHLTICRSGYGSGELDLRIQAERQTPSRSRNFCGAFDYTPETPDSRDGNWAGD